MVTAILLRMPNSVVTTFDGCPMARKGQAERALAVGIGMSACRHPAGDRQ
ncbi:tripartite tricarboxylate transporter permease [Salipiger aestuarii]